MTAKTFVSYGRNEGYDSSQMDLVNIFYENER